MVGTPFAMPPTRKAQSLPTGSGHGAHWAEVGLFAAPVTWSSGPSVQFSNNSGSNNAELTPLIG